MFSPHEFPPTPPAPPRTGLQATPRSTRKARPRAALPTFRHASALACLLALRLAATSLHGASTGAATRANSVRPALSFQLLTLDEAVETYAADCVTPKSSFALGETVCAKISNAPFFGFAIRRFDWIDPSGNVVHSTPVTSGTQTTDTFTIPAQQTTLIAPGVTVDNRGPWAVNATGIFDAGLRASAAFDVSDPAGAAADLGVVNFPVGSRGSVNAGADVTFQILAYNVGPDAAANVSLTADVPNNATFVSATQTLGPAFDCEHPDEGAAGESVCTIASLPSRARAGFTFVYRVSGGAADGSRIVNTTDIASPTADPRAANNSSASAVGVVNNAPPATCTLTCPANVVATANTTQGGQPGAFVKYGAASASGECGAVSNSPASGSFFTAGTHTVTSTSQLGGGSCTFTLKVLDTPTPTISCPATKFATAAGDDDSATVSVGVPTFTASGGGTVFGVRSDSIRAAIDADGSVISPALDKPLSDPYPVGITGITWTVTDADGRTATCRQRIVVRRSDCGDDNTNPVITSTPPHITVGTGPGNTSPTVALDDELGRIEATDNCTVTITISGIPPNGFPIGTTPVTHTATDGSGNSVSHVQQVTVIDNTPPFIAAPPNASYVCPSEVPAAHPSQATRGDVFDEDGNLLPPGPPFDNSGSVSVTVSQTSSGAGSAASPLVITRVFTATDPSNNSSSATQTITVIDAAPPTLNVPADIVTHLPLNTPAVSMPVAFAATASDNCSGPVIISYSKQPGSIFNVGTTTVTVTATDAAGNQTTGQFNVTVLYNFTGFFSPVNNLPVLNSVNAGRAVPVKFSLSGNKGSGIFAAGHPASGQIVCNSNDPAAEVTETLTAGGSSLNYDPTSDQYNYVWKTEGSWAGTCRQLVVRFNDGSEHRANFKFK
ncbi:MAG TPA: PxKF domain-containing protein [Pyrinomonadaceae bacterium]|nr:PxKF domain-containing protein [Pyrinomonadaceae bacterium]